MQHSPPPAVPKLPPPALFSLARLSPPSPALLQAEFPALHDGSPYGSCSRTVPRFNADGRFFTPAFILGIDKSTYASRLGWYLLQHGQKVAEWQLEKSKIMVPRPSRNNSYCCVCRTEFQDYLTHTALPSHGQLLRNNDYHKIIGQLCQAFQKRPQESQEEKSGGRKQGRACKRKPIAKLASRKDVRESCGEESLKTIEPAPLQA